MAYIKVKNIPDGEQVRFAEATVVNPNTGVRTKRSGFTAVATANVVRFPDGKLRRLFVDVDPDKTGGFDALWVAMEEDLAEELFATVTAARDPSTVTGKEIDYMKYDQMIVFDSVREILRPLRGFSPNIVPRLCAWVMRQLDLRQTPPVSSVLSEWVVKEMGGGHSRVLLIEINDNDPFTQLYVLLRRAASGKNKALIVDEVDWKERIRHWWRTNTSPPDDASRLVATLVQQDSLWDEL